MDGGSGPFEVGAADVTADRAPQFLDPARRRVEQHEHRGAQATGGAVQVGQLGVAAVLVLAFGVGEQQAGHPVEHDQRVVGGVALELPQGGKKCRGAPIGAQATKGLGLAARP